MNHTRAFAGRTSGLLALCLVAAACGRGGDTADYGSDFSLDGGNGSFVDCPRGQHGCDGECVDDTANFPENGCRLGCGAPCAGEGATCNSDGYCEQGCAAGYENQGGACVCPSGPTCESAGVACGPIDDGCGGTLDCGGCDGDAACVGGQCTGACNADLAEPNDKQESAYALGEFTDSPKSSATWTDFAIDSDIDSDWFVATVKDKFGITTFGNPDVKVTLNDIPAGDVYDLAVWYVCDGGGGGGSCDEGSEDEGDGHACLANTVGGEAIVKISTSCDGTNESGTAIIRVRASTWTASCNPYTLTVSVD
ncbi:MAG: hypothetical protein R3A78_03150 [Polyangiales bacterium]|nr:hypothetical protein [Myxococcales bacterium]